MSFDRRYIHVFPRSAVFDELKAAYGSASSRMPWMSVESLEDWGPDPERLEWWAPENVLIFWGLLPAHVPANRTASFVFRFTESVGDPELLSAGQLESMVSFVTRAKEPDLVLCGNATIADYWSCLCRKVAVAPIGYEKSVFGEPDWGVEKCFDVSFRGSHVERRTWLMEAIRTKFEDKFLWIKSFGLERQKMLNQCRVDLYLGHCQDYSFPGMRLWQNIASSAALVSERRDAWPAIPGKHYVSVEPATKTNIKRFLSELEYTISHYPLAEMAKTAHQELSLFTIDRCMEEFVIPATRGLSR